MRRLLVVVLGSVLTLSACDGNGGGGGGGAGGSVEAYCEAVLSFQELEQELEEGPDIPDDASPQEAFAAMRESFERLRGRVEELRGVAPAEIRNEVNQLVEAVVELIDLFVEMDDPTDLAANQEALTRMGELQEEVAAAQERVGAFTEEECGIDLDQGDPDVPPPGDSTEVTPGDTGDDSTEVTPGDTGGDE